MTKVMPFGVLTDENGNRFKIYSWEIEQDYNCGPEYRFVCYREIDEKEKELQSLRTRIESAETRATNAEQRVRELRDKIERIQMEVEDI